jgi:UDP-glucuronate decarboxylase
MSESPIFEKKNVLVTGGAGFIGSHLCEQLLKEARVICIDDFSNSSSLNIDHLLPYDDFVFIKHNVNEPFELEQFEELNKFKIQFQGVQEIYHLACPTSIKNFEHLKLETLLSNSSGMRNTLEVAVRYRAKYLFTSSSIVYGSRREGRVVFEETDEGIVDHMSPRACYDEGKRFAETMVETYRQVYSIDTKIARVFRTYGPRLKINDAQPPLDFIINALENKDIVVFGDGNRTSLCYVSDVVDALVRLMHHSEQIGPVNVGDDQDYPIEDVIQKIIEMTKSSSKIVHEQPLPFLSSLGLPSLVKAKDKIGWFPLVRLEDGLQRTIDYAVANKGALGLSI